MALRAVTSLAYEVSVPYKGNRGVKTMKDDFRKNSLWLKGFSAFPA